MKQSASLTSKTGVIPADVSIGMAASKWSPCLLSSSPGVTYCVQKASELETVITGTTLPGAGAVPFGLGQEASIDEGNATFWSGRCVTLLVRCHPLADNLSRSARWKGRL